ncbi:NUDIX domain-containing protein [Streptomyces sp. NPDC000405]|uniref:NUDIX domain-containing protein n=1 Tax=Streptomyces sp. NPDC000405 TaxID=3161033 RepID=UPI00398D016C
MYLRNAASGLVVRDNHVLLARGTWPDPNSETYWLPGGGQQPGETLAACAEREVHEETGVRVKAGSTARPARAHRRQPSRQQHPIRDRAPPGRGHLLVHCPRHPRHPRREPPRRRPDRRRLGAARQGVRPADDPALPTTPPAGAGSPGRRWEHPDRLRRRRRVTRPGRSEGPASAGPSRESSGDRI